MANEFNLEQAAAEDVGAPIPQGQPTDPVVGALQTIAALVAAQKEQGNVALVQAFQAFLEVLSGAGQAVPQAPQAPQATPQPAPAPKRENNQLPDNAAPAGAVPVI